MISLELGPAGQPACERRKQMRDGSHCGQDNDQDQGWIIGQAEGHCQATPCKSEMKHREGEERKHRTFSNTLADMTELVMPQLMRENGQDFVRAVFLQERIEEDDALGPPQAGKISIAMG